MTNQKQVEAEGYVAGANSLDTQAAREEIRAMFAEMKEEAIRKALPRLKKLTAREVVLKSLRDEAQKRWANMKALTKERLPQVFLPFTASVFSFVLCVGETALLAPITQGLGIAHEVMQLLVAGVIVLALTGLVKITAWYYRKPESSFVWRVVFTLLCVSSLVFLGWFRAAELIYATAQGANKLKSFLSQAEGLTTLVLTLLTVTLPVVAGIALDWGLENLRLAWEWRNARRANTNYIRKHENAKQTLEAAKEQLARTEKIIDRQCDSFTQAYLNAYEQGRTLGAEPFSLKLLMLRVLAFGLLTMFAVFVSAYIWLDEILLQAITTDGARLMLYGAAWLGATACYAAFEIKAWLRPSAAQIYAQRQMIRRSNRESQNFDDIDERTVVTAPRQ